jgi:predicted TPR repeat methyltransferase
VLADRDTKYDLIISADTFIYVGALDNVFKAAGDALASGGILAFSIEEEDGDEFSLATTSRYKHSKKYIERLGTKNRLSIKHDEKIGIGMQLDTNIPGRVMLLEKE